MAMLPIVMGPSGMIPQTPKQLRDQLVQRVSRTNPDYTANLPSSLIEDIVSTDVGALITSNQFLVDLVNSVSPYAANAFILNQLGVDVYGIQPAVATNTAVDLIFFGVPGFIIIPGFTVSDGVYQYVCTNGGVIGTNGESLPIHAISPTTGTWAVPIGTVNALITSVPVGILLSCTNPNEGIPSISSETISSFRSRTLIAGLAASTGMDRYLKTLLGNVPGVVQRLVSVRQDIDSGRWIVLVGGGDPYQVAWAIYYALFDIQSLERPLIDITNITNANIALVTTATNHNLLPGMHERITDLNGMTPLNGNFYYVNITGANTLTLWNNYDPLTGTFTNPVDTTNTAIYPLYISGGQLSPNPILQQVSLNSYPDTYIIPFILPAQQLVTMVVTWNTDYPNYVPEQAVSQAAIPALVDYINSLYVGISPLNIYDMQSIFIESVKNIVPSENITVLSFIVSFDGIGHLPEPGTGIVPGDPNSYFYTTSTNINVVHA